MKEKKVKTNVIDYYVLKEIISPDNVLEMAEGIAFAEVRYLIGYIGSRMQKMYADLYDDMLHRNEPNHVFSDSYDLVQECALFLCEHCGKRLSDVIGHTKKGKKITVQIACIRKMNKLINRRTSDCYRCISVEELIPACQPSIEIDEEITQDYTLYDKIIESLNLTENMKIALECRISGLSYPEISRNLERAQSTVIEYFTKMRQRYTAIYY